MRRVWESDCTGVGENQAQSSVESLDAMLERNGCVISWTEHRRTHSLTHTNALKT